MTTSPITPAAVSEGKSACAAGSTPRSRKPKLTGLALIASLMPENGGSESLDGKLRKMLADSFPQLLIQHNSDSRRAHSGWPDWAIAGERRFIVRELKREGTEPTEAQAAWLAALRGAGVDAGIWRPSHLLSGQIARELAALAGLTITEVPGGAS